MKVKSGFDDKELQIRIGNAGSENRTAELWIDFKVPEKMVQKETLSYITLEELLDLKNEIDKAIQEIVK